MVSVALAQAISLALRIDIVRAVCVVTRHGRVALTPRKFLDVSPVNPPCAPTTLTLALITPLVIGLVFGTRTVIRFALTAVNFVSFRSKTSALIIAVVARQDDIMPVFVSVLSLVVIRALLVCDTSYTVVADENNNASIIRTIMVEESAAQVLLLTNRLILV